MDIFYVLFKHRHQPSGVNSIKKIVLLMKSVLRIREEKLASETFKIARKLFMLNDLEMFVGFSCFIKRFLTFLRAKIVYKFFILLYSTV